MEAFDYNVLVGDIGGTKTNLAIFSSQSGLRTPLLDATFSSQEYPSLEMLTLDFLSQTKLSIETASFCVSGPVVEGKAHITNLPWVIEEAKLAAALRVSTVHLFNDLLAFAHSIPLLKSSDIYSLNPGRESRQSAILVIAPGTGLGQAYLTWNGRRFQTHSSEGGHVDFAPTNELEIGLLKYLLNQYDHVSYERVCSGIGLPKIYEYLKKTGPDSEPGWLSEKLSESNNSTAVICAAALDEDKSCRLCQRTLDTFVSILGAAAGNGALSMMALGGVYIGGGIPPHILPALKKKSFMAAFTNKGRFSELMKQIPVYVILNPKVALLGAASLAMG